MNAIQNIIARVTANVTAALAAFGAGRLSATAVARDVLDNRDDAAPILAAIVAKLNEASAKAERPEGKAARILHAAKTANAPDYGKAAVMFQRQFNEQLARAVKNAPNAVADELRKMDAETLENVTDEQVADMIAAAESTIAPLWIGRKDGAFIAIPRSEMKQSGKRTDESEKVAKALALVRDAGHVVMPGDEFAELRNTVTEASASEAETITAARTMVTEQAATIAELQQKIAELTAELDNLRSSVPNAERPKTERKSRKSA